MLLCRSDVEKNPDRLLHELHIARKYETGVWWSIKISKAKATNYFQATQRRGKESRPGNQRCGVLQTGVGCLLEIAVERYLGKTNLTIKGSRKPPIPI